MLDVNAILTMNIISESGMRLFATSFEAWKFGLILKRFLAKREDNSPYLREDVIDAQKFFEQ